MNNKRLMVRSLALGWLVVASSDVQAQTEAFPRRLDLRLTATVQGDVVQGEPVKTSTVTLGSKDLLALAAKALGTNFSKDAFLALSGTNVVVVDRTGAVVSSLSGCLTVEPGATSVLSDDMRGMAFTPISGGNIRTVKAAAVVQIRFDDRAGNAFTLWALLQETGRFHGNRQRTGATETLSTQAPLLGSGSLGGKTAMFSGRLMAVGRTHYTIDTSVGSGGDILIGFPL